MLKHASNVVKQLSNIACFSLILMFAWQIKHMY